MRAVVMAAIVAALGGGLLLQPTLAGNRPGDPESVTGSVGPQDPGEDRTVPDSTPELNLAGRANVIFPHLEKDRAKKWAQERDSKGLPTETPGTMESGLWILDGFGFTGAVAYHDVQTDVVLTGSVDQTLYAPTMAVPTPGGKIGCLETVTVHYRLPSQGMTQTAHAHGFWDHCVAHGWVSFKSTTNSTFRSKYVRAIGDWVVYTRVEKDTGGTWRGYLYNYNTHAWEQQAAVSSTNYPGTWPGGWTMFETYGFAEEGNCQPLPIIRSNQIQVKIPPATWTYLQPSYSSRFEHVAPGMDSCFNLGLYWFHINAANYDWQVCNFWNYC